MELEEVVGGGDQLPFGLNGLLAASVKACDRAEMLDVGKDRFDDLLALGVASLASVGIKQRADPFGMWTLGWLFLRGETWWRPAVGEMIVVMAWSSRASICSVFQSSIAQIAETTYNDRRLVVRRVRTLDNPGQLLPTWELFPFVSNRTDALTLVESERRAHAQVELAIHDLKDQALAHFPSGRFFANAAWTVVAALAHNLLRQTQLLGLPTATIRTASTVRRRLLTLPGRLVRTVRRWTLRMPARWPWAEDFTAALTRLRALPPPA